MSADQSQTENSPEPTRFEVMEEHTYGDNSGYEHAYVIYTEASEVISDIFGRTISPNGVSGKARTVYEVVLEPDVEEVVPAEIAATAGTFDLDITAVEEREVPGGEGPTQTALLLEPADTEMYPR